MRFKVTKLLMATVVGHSIELIEGQGCQHFHGAACGFSATLARKR